MKPTVIILTMLICAINISAQTNYYNATKTFNEKGYTYQCDLLEKAKYVTLYNKENKYTNVLRANRYTGEIISIKFRKVYFESEDWTKPKCRAIVSDAFSPAERQRLKGSGLSISMYIDPDTGKVIDVKFNFVTFRPFATIPVSVFRKIELELKKNIWFTPTAEGKKLNYIFLGWRQKFK